MVGPKLELHSGTLGQTKLTREVRDQGSAVLSASVHNSDPAARSSAGSVGGIVLPIARVLADEGLTWVQDGVTCIPEAGVIPGVVGRVAVGAGDGASGAWPTVLSAVGAFGMPVEMGVGLDGDWNGGLLEAMKAAEM